MTPMADVSFAEAKKWRVNLQVPDENCVIVGESEVANKIRQFAEMVSKTDTTILVQGETGSGKDNLAEFISKLSGRGEFVTVDCGAMTETLWESELLGHTLGAFTDARQAKRGLIEVARNGTLFFDEIGNMSLQLQAKLLRIAEKKPYRQLGGEKQWDMDFRLIAATNVNLAEAVSRGQFRADLYHRLNVLGCTIPPLRERREDIVPLSEHFLEWLTAEKARYTSASVAKKFDQSAYKALLAYDWPGNVRELQNVVVKADFNAKKLDKITSEHILPCLEGVGRTEVTKEKVGSFPTFHEAQKQYILGCLRKTRGNQVEAARIAGVSPRVLNYIIRERFDLVDEVENIRRGVE
jgi:transcriptional regulator with PAS, ATPase and Fis domain